MFSYEVNSEGRVYVNADVHFCVLQAIYQAWLSLTDQRWDGIFLIHPTM